jgi:hypothetical protein
VILDFLWSFLIAIGRIFVGLMALAIFFWLPGYQPLSSWLVE